MRQSFFIIAVFLLFLFVVQFFTVNFNDKEPAESFISDDVVFFSTQKDLEKRLKRLAGSRLGQKMRAIEFEKIAEKFELHPEDIGEIEKLFNEIQETLNRPIVKEIFGNEVSIAMYPFEPVSYKNLEKELLENTLLIARPRYHGKIIKILAEFSGGTRNISSARYGGHTITRFPVSNNQVVAVIKVDGQMLFSYSEPLLRKSIDVYDTELLQLSGRKWFSVSRKRFESADCFCFLNIERLREIIQKRPSEERLHYQGLKNAFWGSWSDSKKSTQRLIVDFEPEEMEPGFKELFAIQPGISESYRKLSDETIWCYWTNVFRPKQLLEVLTQHRAGKTYPSAATFVDKISIVTGIESNELFSLFENDLTIAVKNIKRHQFVPIPPSMIAVKLHDSATVKRVIESITTHYELPFVKKTVKGRDIYYWGGDPGIEDIRPTYAVVDGYLLIATNAEQIVEFFHESSRKDALEKSLVFKGADTGFGQANNSINFIRINKVVDLAQELVNWGGTLMIIIDHERALKAKIVIDHLVVPILDGLKMYSAMGIRSYVSENRLTVDSVITIQ